MRLSRPREIAADSAFLYDPLTTSRRGVMPVEPWFIVAVGASFLGYAIYLAGLRERLVEPNAPPG